MSSTYSTNLALELIGTGDQAGTWGNTTNTNLGTLIEQAISGYVTQAVSTGTDTTITIPNGATGVARNMYIELTGTGGTNTNLIVPANKKLYFIFNNASGAVTVKVSGQTGVSVPAGKKVVLASNGTDTVNALNYIADFGSNSATITQLTATSATITNLTLTSLVISNLSIASANITTLTSSSATISTTLALSGGTANGVLYLNGSKVATSGSALTFDGSSFLVGATSAAAGKAVIKDTASSNTLWLIGRTSDGASSVSFRNAADSAYNARLEGVSGQLIFEANGTEAMRLTSTTLYTASGINVGIGTSSPATKLDTAGTVRSTTQTVPSSGTGAELYYDATNAGLRGYNRTGAAYVNLALNDNMYVGGGSSGNVGIGTSSLFGVLNLQTSTNARIEFGSASTAGSLEVLNNARNAYLDYDVYALVHRWRKLGSIAMTLDSSGNLGLGVTPSAWRSTEKAIQIGSWMGLYTDSGLTSEVSYNTYINSSNQYIYQNTGYASRYQQYLGDHAWFTAASGTAAGTISFGNAKMVLTNAGNLGVGTTSPNIGGVNKAITVNSATSTNCSYELSVNNVLQGSLFTGISTSSVALYTVANGPLLFGTNNTERARITSGGYFKASNTGSYVGSTGAYHEAVSDGTGNTLVVRNSSTSTDTDGTIFISNARNTTDNTYYILSAYNTTAAAFKFRVADSGNVTNTNGSYGTISDAKMKTDIVDASSQWGDIKAIRFRKFKMKDDPQQITQLGVVAQELEQTSPGLVEEHADRDAEGNDLGTTTKSVKTSILLMKAAIALQEAMTRIEQLEAKVAALESK